MEHISRQIDVNGQMLFVEFSKIDANRPTIVFLHDSLGCVALWRDFPKRLAEATGCNFVVYDRLGYGKSAAMPTYVRPVHYLESEADTLNVLLATLEIDDAILFGHSDGGTIALLAANKHPCRVKAVICEAAHIFVEDATLKGIYEAIDTYKQTDLPTRLRKYHGDKVEMLFQAWAKTWTRDDFRSWNIEPQLSGISCPLLFIQGESDEFGTLEQMYRTIANLSGYAEKCILPGIGHSPHKEAPDEVINTATTFLRQYV